MGEVTELAKRRREVPARLERARDKLVDTLTGSQLEALGDPQPQRGGPHFRSRAAADSVGSGLP